MAGKRGLGALRSLGAALVLVHLLGCASEPRRGRHVLLGAENRVFLILPFNVAAVMPPELEPLSPIIWSELEFVLRAHDKQLKTVAPAVARKLWIQSIQQVRAGEQGARAGFDEAAGSLAVELRKHAEFDVMAAPSLFIREANISNRIASWDGIEREVQFEARGLEARSLANTPLEGVAPAASLHVAVFDAQGEKLHEGQGGLDLLVRVRIVPKDPPAAPGFEFSPRNDVFGNRAQLREGISAAFAPFLAPLPE